MIKLFLDVGNTRVKRALMVDGQYDYLDAIEVNEFITSDDIECLFNGHKPDAVYIASVTSFENLEAIKNVIQSHFGLFPVVLTAQKNCCGLTSGYDDFHKLGDDRWMAMQGALSYSSGPTIVISAGTAMTIDAVMDGKHLGGFIVPGLDSLRASLATDTAALTLTKPEDIVETTKVDDGALLATNTESAILGGTLYMTASFINSIISDLNNQVQTLFKVIVTGGNASKLIPLIDARCDYIPDLILQGMINVEESVKKS